MTKVYAKGLKEYNEMIYSDKADIETKKKLLEQLPDADLERGLYQLIYLEDMYDDIKSYLHKLNRIISKGYLSLSPTQQYLNMIECNLKTIDMLLGSIREDETYRALKKILKERGEKR